MLVPAAHTLVCWDPEGALLPGWLQPEGTRSAAGLVPLRRLGPRPLQAASSISLSFSCSSFRKESTNRLFSLLIWSLMSVGMSGIIQSTRTLRNITRFFEGQKGGGERRGGAGGLHRPRAGGAGRGEGTDPRPGEAGGLWVPLAPQPTSG